MIIHERLLGNLVDSRSETCEETLQSLNCQFFIGVRLGQFTESDGTVIYFQGPPLECWEELHRYQYSWPTTTLGFPFIPTSEPI